MAHAVRPAGAFPAVGRGDAFRGRRERALGNGACLSAEKPEDEAYPHGGNATSTRRTPGGEVAMRHKTYRLLLAAGCCCFLPLSAAGCESASDRVQINVQSLVGDARDGSLLAEQIVAGRAGAVFARGHAQELQDDADQVEKNVYDQRLPGHEAI